MTKRTGSRDARPRIDTMEKLSQAIGVSRPTLSRYFQDPDRVSAGSVEKIRAGLERVEYTPNFFATRMNRKSTGMIGVLIPYLNDLFFTRLQEAIESAAQDAGFTVITQCSHYDPALEAKAVETFLSMNVDGALVAPLGNQSDMSLHQRLNARMPFVLMISRPQTLMDVDYVGSDHTQSTGLIIDYLCRLGRPPVFLAMPPVNFNARARLAVYRDRMAAAELAPEVIGAAAVVPAKDYEAHGYATLDAAFAQGLYTDRAILCANDRVAIGALAAAARYGLVPGRDPQGGLRIAGHDDYPLCPYTSPTLTTVAQDVDAIGAAAVRRLTAKIRGETPADAATVNLHPGTLVVRGSA